VVLDVWRWSRNTKSCGDATVRLQMQFHDSDTELERVKDDGEGG
jgi:hypothetical protein